MKKTVMIVDDSTIVRNGLKSILSPLDDFDIIAMCTCGAEGITTAMEKKPDIMLIDSWMPDLNGYEVAKCIQAHLFETKTVILTSIEDESDRESIIHPYLNGCIHKDMNPDQMIDILRTIRTETHAYQNRNVPSQESASKINKSTVSPHKPIIKLTRREKEILELIAKSYSNADIAERLFISETTVKSHVSRILRKLDQPNRSQAVLFAVQYSIISFPSLIKEQKNTV